MCICICVCAIICSIYTEPKSKSKVWEKWATELLQRQLPQKLQASFREQWHLRKWFYPEAAGNLVLLRLTKQPTPTMQKIFHEQHLLKSFRIISTSLYPNPGTETLWPCGCQKIKKHNVKHIKHRVFKEISPLHSSIRPPVGSIDTATSALAAQRSAPSVAHCCAVRLPTSATVPPYFSLRRHSLLAQASCHPLPTHVTMVRHKCMGEDLPVTRVTTVEFWCKIADVP